MTIERDGLRSRVQTLTNCRVDSCYDERTRIKADYDTMRHTKERLQAEVAELKADSASLSASCKRLSDERCDLLKQLAARRVLTETQAARARELRDTVFTSDAGFPVQWWLDVRDFLRSLVEQETTSQGD